MEELVIEVRGHVGGAASGSLLATPNIERWVSQPQLPHDRG